MLIEDKNDVIAIYAKRTKEVSSLDNKTRRN